MPGTRTPLFQNRRWLWALLLLASALLLWRIFFTQDDSRRGMRMEAPPVRVAPALAQDVPRYLSGLGTVLPSSDVLVTSRVDGHLLKLHFREGQRVRAGDLLAEIDPRPFQAELEKARGALARDEAQLANARKDLDRYAKLVKDKYIAAQQYETQRALVRQYEGTVATDRAAVESAQLQLTYSRITAPASGRLGLRTVDEGNMVHASDAAGLVRITEISPCDAVFTLPGTYVHLVVQALREAKTEGRPGPAVQAWDKEGKTRLDTGYLLSMDNQIDIATGTVKLKARFPNKGENRLFANQFVNVRLLAYVLRGAVTVPTAAVQLGARGSYLYVVTPDGRDGRRVALREVEPGMSTNSLTVITRGLAAGELVVMDGLDRLRDGLPVRVAAQGQTPKAEVD